MEIHNANKTPQYSSLFGIKDYNIDKISSPSDLIGMELLPEYTSESEYGVLKFNPIVIPDFSNNDEEFEYFEMCFNDIKKFITEKNLLEKGDAAFYMKKHISWLPIDYGDNKVYDFARALDTSFYCRLFESGEHLRYDICTLFAPCDKPAWRYIPDILLYNKTNVNRTLSYSTGIYIQSLGICKNKISYPDSHTNEIICKIFNHIPTYNYLSWAFHYASLNCSLMNSFSGKTIALFA